jgi:hypothetical protein
MDLDMWQRLRQQLPTRITGGTSGKVMAALVILVVPGGLMLPLCYAAYAALSCTYAARANKSSSTAERPM